MKVANAREKARETFTRVRFLTGISIRRGLANLSN